MRDSVRSIEPPRAEPRAPSSSGSRLASGLASSSTFSPWLFAVGAAFVVGLGCPSAEHALCEHGDRVRAGDGCRFCDCSHGNWQVPDKGCAGLRAPTDGAACYLTGIQDVDEEVGGLQIECMAENSESNGRSQEVPRCVDVGSELAWPSEVVDVCWFARIGDAASPSCHAQTHDRPAVEIGALVRPGTGDPPELIDIVCTHAPLCPGWPPDSTSE